MSDWLFADTKKERVKPEAKETVGAVHAEKEGLKWMLVKICSFCLSEFIAEYETCLLICNEYIRIFVTFFFLTVEKIYKSCQKCFTIQILYS